MRRVRTQTIARNVILYKHTYTDTVRYNEDKRVIFNDE